MGEAVSPAETLSNYANMATTQRQHSTPTQHANAAYQIEQHLTFSLFLMPYIHTYIWLFTSHCLCKTVVGMVLTGHHR